MVRISAVVISSSAAKSLLVHMALVLASQFSTAARSAAVCAADGGGLTGAGAAPPQAVRPRLATAASDTAATRILPVRFMVRVLPAGRQDVARQG